MTLLSLSSEGVQLQKEAMIADDHFDINYWQTTTNVSNTNTNDNEHLIDQQDHSSSMENPQTIPSATSSLYTPQVIEASQDNQYDVLTTSALPSTTLGVTAIKLYNARYLLYDTPGVCPSAYRVRLLNAMMMDEQSKIKMLFPRKRVVPTVFSIHPNQSVLLGSLACIDYKTIENVRIDNGVSFELIIEC